MKGIKNQVNHKERSQYESSFSQSVQDRVIRFHRSMEAYQATDLYSLDHLANYLGLGKIWLKDESSRFNLNAFKGLGASYALADYLSKDLDLDESDLTWPQLEEAVGRMPKMTLATATDGNHGKSLAWAGRLFQQDVVVHMPYGASNERIQAIQDLDAQVVVTDVNYDETVAALAQEAQEKSWLLVQDTAWSGYEKIPLAIMQGYTTIISEVFAELKEELSQMTHVILQVGVGSFAAAMSTSLLAHLPQRELKIIIAESNQADPYYQSIRQGFDQPVLVDGDLDTMMAGLSCGKANPIAWDLLSKQAHFSFSCSDSVAARGMRVLGNPLQGDPAIVAGESGALPAGLLYELSKDNVWRNKLNLNSESKLLMINTEGDTDPVNYRKVVWG